MGRDWKINTTMNMLSNVLLLLLTTYCMSAPTTVNPPTEGENTTGLTGDYAANERWGKHHHHDDDDFPVGVPQSCRSIWCGRGYHCEMQAGSCTILIFFCAASSPACVKDF